MQPADQEFLYVHPRSKCCMWTDAPLNWQLELVRWRWGPSGASSRHQSSGFVLKS